MKKKSNTSPKRMRLVRQGVVANMLVAMLLLIAMTACSSSRAGYFGKHRKKRHCDCPTFTLTQPSAIQTPPATTQPYDTVVIPFT